MRVVLGAGAERYPRVSTRGQQQQQQQQAAVAAPPVAQPVPAGSLEAQLLSLDTLASGARQQRL